VRLNLLLLQFLYIFYDFFTFIVREIHLSAHLVKHTAEPPDHAIQIVYHKELDQYYNTKNDDDDCLGSHLVPQTKTCSNMSKIPPSSRLSQSPDIPPDELSSRKQNLAYIRISLKTYLFIPSEILPFEGGD